MKRRYAGTARTGRVGAALAAIAMACGGDSAPTGANQGTSSSGGSTAAVSTERADTTGTGAGQTTAILDGSGSSSGTGGGPAYPDPASHPPNTGPGGPAVAFDASDLFMGCAFLNGGASDMDHHNLVVMFDGYLLLPWSPEWGGGGISFYDISDPCQPQVLGHTTASDMRESHSLGFGQLGDRWYAVTAAKDFGLNFEGGILLWDVTDVAAPEVVATLFLPGHLYPDAYARVVLSSAFAAPYIYVGGADNGIYVVDASVPDEPQMVEQYGLEPTLRVGQVSVIGNLLVATAAEGPRTVLLDVSVPEFPQPIPGGDFDITDDQGVNVDSYFSNVGGGYVYYAVTSGGGGVAIYDIHDPQSPAQAGYYSSGGNGGYVFAKDELAFVGESNFAGIYDLTDMNAITQLATLELEGDLDTMTPIGNVAILSVDADAVADQATAIAPYATAVDTAPPRVTWASPVDGATDLPISSRVGATFSEMVDVKSAWFGAVRLHHTDANGELVAVPGHISVQENVVNFSPASPLDPGTTYTFEIPAGGVADYNGNRTDETFSITFTTIGG